MKLSRLVLVPLTACAVALPALPAAAGPLTPTRPVATTVSPCPKTATTCTVRRIGPVKLMTWTDATGRSWSKRLRR